MFLISLQVPIIIVRLINTVFEVQKIKDSLLKKFILWLRTLWNYMDGWLPSPTLLKSQLSSTFTRMLETWDLDLGLCPCFITNSKATFSWSAIEDMTILRGLLMNKVLRRTQKPSSTMHISMMWSTLIPFSFLVALWEVQLQFTPLHSIKTKSEEWFLKTLSLQWEIWFLKSFLILDSLSG